ncbi:MAG: arsenite methyltransferase [Chloroflexota bacterium]
MDENRNEIIRTAVRENYGKIGATGSSGCSCSSSGGCCSSADDGRVVDISLSLGYSAEDLLNVPDGANLGLGCGNPYAIAALKSGETVLDLGSGGGLDCFLAAKAVGPLGRVIGVDMSPEMISRARQNAQKGGYTHVEFRLGEIEHLPVGDSSVDVILSNCVINLSPDKEQVFREAFRVLKPGGRLAVSDVVAIAELPAIFQEDMALYTSCAAGAATIQELERILQQAGFVEIQIQPKDESKSFIKDWSPGSKIEDYVVSAVIEARKPSVS